MKDWNEAHNKGVAIRAYADQAKPWSGNVIPLAPERRLIIPSRDFVKNYIAPKYIVEGILQQNRLYSLTGKTGDGKTALQLYLAQLWALGVPLGARDVEKCRVLYLAGENPDDVRARWLAMSDELEFDPETINVHFVEGVFSVSASRRQRPSAGLGPSSLIPARRSSRAMRKTTMFSFWLTRECCGS